jgi:hypothetical protein
MKGGKMTEIFRSTPFLPAGRRCVYWIEHVDFPTGYFGSMKAAKEYANAMYIA